MLCDGMAAIDFGILQGDSFEVERGPLPLTSPLQPAFESNSTMTPADLLLSRFFLGAMRGCHRLRSGLILLSFTLPTPAFVHASPAGPTPAPNVILILTDDQGYGDMACHGNPWLKTPHLDRMHNESVRLDDYHVDPVCTPTRAALMTGRHSLRVGAWTVTEGRQLLDPDETTMAEVFRASGYRTGMFGKWHLGDAFPYASRFRGFDDVVCHRAGGVDEIGNPKGNDYFDDTYYRNGVAEKFEGYCTDVFFDELLRFIGDAKEKKDGDSDQAGRPFFAYLPLNAMHGPFTVDNSYSDRFRKMGLPEDRAEFYGMVENFDENLGRLFVSLQERGLDNHTVVIFMGDNGSAGGARVIEGHEGYNAGMRGAKGDVYEGGHRVACFVRWPGRLPAGHAIDALTTHHDWLPTLVDLCGLTLPEPIAFDGRTLRPLLEGEAASWPEPRTVFVARHADQPKLWTANIGKKQKYPRRAVLTERWRLVDGELYDIPNDPGQQNDVARAHPEVVSELDAAYRSWWEDAMSHEGAYTRFVLGAEEENPTAFTVRDWHPAEGRVIWKKPQLAEDDRFLNGFWAVEVKKAGRYRVTLRRFPADEPAAIGANSARLRIGDIEKTVALDPDDIIAEFELDLPTGPALLQTWLTDAKTGRERGAYFVEVIRDGDSVGELAAILRQPSIPK